MATVVSLVQQVKDRLEDDGLLQVVEGLGDPVNTDPAVPLVQLYPDPGNAYRERVAGGAQTVVWNLRLVLSGPTARAALWAAEHVRGLLTDWRPDPDRASSPLNESDDEVRLLQDTTADLGDPSYSITLHYRMHKSRSTPA